MMADCQINSGLMKVCLIEGCLKTIHVVNDNFFLKAYMVQKVQENLNEYILREMHLYLYPNLLKVQLRCFRNIFCDFQILRILYHKMKH